MGGGEAGLMPKTIPMGSMIIHRMAKEVKEDPPAALVKQRRKKGKKAAEKMRRAIILSKARRAGARIPRKPDA